MKALEEFRGGLASASNVELANGAREEGFGVTGRRHLPGTTQSFTTACRGHYQ